MKVRGGCGLCDGGEPRLMHPSTCRRPAGSCLLSLHHEAQILPLSWVREGGEGPHEASLHFQHQEQKGCCWLLPDPAVDPDEPV